MQRDDDAPPPIVHRTATELPPEELQAEFARYGIPAGDAGTRVNALQLKYDDEFETSQREYEEYQKRLHMKKVKHEYEEAVREMKELEEGALARDDKATTIVNQVVANAAPKHLVVRGISPLACCALLRAMRCNSNVLTLDLSNNRLDDLVSEAIAKMLLKNKRLRGLSIGFNLFTCHALGPLGKALQENAVLTSLSLESTPMMANNSGVVPGSNGSSGGNANGGPGHLTTMLAFESFMKAIAINTTLTSLNLFNTQMTFDVGRAIARALENNTTLIALEVGGNTVTQPDLASISCKLQKNQLLQAHAQEKDAWIRHEIKHSAEEIHEQNERLAKQKANAEWHEANAKERAEKREKEEWERARLVAEEEMRVALEIEAQQKKYMQQIEEKKNAKPTKGKK